MDQTQTTHAHEQKDDAHMDEPMRVDAPSTKDASSESARTDEKTETASAAEQAPNQATPNAPSAEDAQKDEVPKDTTKTQDDASKRPDTTSTNASAAPSTDANTSTTTNTATSSDTAGASEQDNKSESQKDTPSQNALSRDESASTEKAASASQPEQPPPPKQEAQAAPESGTSSSSQAADGTSSAPAQEATPADDGLTHMDIAMPHVKYAQNTIRSLKSRREAGAFLQPVDPIALRVPHYTQIIKEPMDLGTIDQKLALTSHRLKTAQGGPNRMTDKLKQAIDSGRIHPDKDYYTNVDQFERDVFRVFDNCVYFNGAEHIFSKNAEALRAVFEKQRKGLATAVAVAEEANSPAVSYTHLRAHET